MRSRERFPYQKGLYIYHPLSLLKSELIMPLNILNEKVTAMIDRNGSNSGVFLSQAMMKRQRARLRTNQLHLLLDKKNFFLNDDI